MLNRIKVIGKVLPIEAKENPNPEKERLVIYFSLLVTNPTGSETILRCVAQGEMAEKLEKEVKNDEILEVVGYLRNEKVGMQILIKILKFTKLDINFEDIDNNRSNQVCLLGKIVKDKKNQEGDISLRQSNAGIVSFRLLVPWKGGNERATYFCRSSKKLVPEITSRLKAGDVIFLEGFLQTKKNKREEEIKRENKEEFDRISSIICRAFVLLDRELFNDWHSLGKLELVEKPIEKIDFTKPKERNF
jgi:hypothetical protein